MKVLLNSFACALLCLVLTGCPYNSSVTLDEKPIVEINKALLGTWQEEETESSGGALYTITADGDFMYKIDKTEGEMGNSTTYSGFLSNVKGSVFLNLKEGEERYSFYKIKFNSDKEIELMSVSENVDESFTTSAQLRTFFEQNQHLSFFYDKEDITYTKLY